METPKLPISSAVLVLGVLLSCTPGHAEESNNPSQIKDFYALFAKEPTTASGGHYEYNSGGVPLLGLVMRLPDDPPPSDDTRVSFRTCSNTTLEVQFGQLHRVTKKCQPIKKPKDLFAVDTLAPLIKTESKPNNPTVKFHGQIINLNKLPATYTDAVAKAKPGDWVGYGFMDKDGSRRAVFLASEPRAGGTIQ